MENNKASKRIEWIDIAKGWGILLVFLGHLVTYGSGPFRWIFSFHIPLFFFLSGYTFHLRNGWKEDFSQIWKSLISPYLIFSLLGLAITIIVPGWYLGPWRAVLYQFLYSVQPEALHIGQIWFLFCLAMAQIFLIFLKRFCFPTKVEIVFIACAFIAAIGFDQLHQRDFLGRLPWKLDSALMAFVFLYFGNECKRRGWLGNLVTTSKSKLLLTFMVAMGFCVFFSAHLNHATANLAENHYGNPVLYILPALCGIMAVIALSAAVRSNKFLSYYGRNSLPIFAVHSFFLYLYAFLLSQIFSRKISIMQNISLPYCFIGLVFVAASTTIVPVLYGKAIYFLKLLKRKYETTRR